MLLKRYNLFLKIEFYEFELGKASYGNTVVNHSTTDRKIKGLNPATDCHLEKMAEKQINTLGLLSQPLFSFFQ